MILIQDAPDAAEVAPSLSGAEAAIMDHVEATWGPLCDSYAAQYGLPLGWLQAMVFRESAGDPHAFRREPNGWTGVGLLQITHPSLKGGRRVDGKWMGMRPDSEIAIPSVNLDIGARYTASHFKVYGDDFPRVCAAFNSGSAHVPADAEHDNPWSLHSTGSHISKEVAALNYWLIHHKQVKSAGPVALLDLRDMAMEADNAARRELA